MVFFVGPVGYCGCSVSSVDPLFDVVAIFGDVPGPDGKLGKVGLHEGGVHCRMFGFSCFSKLKMEFAARFYPFLFEKSAATTIVNL